MFFELIDWRILISAAIAGLSVGALWYSPMVFGRQWAILTGIKTGELAAQWKSLILMFVTMLATALGLKYLLFFQEIKYLETAMELTLMVWATIALPVLATSTIFEKRSWKLLLLNSLYQLTAMIVISLIIVHFA